MTTVLTAGLGLKPQHYDEALACTADGLWFEVHPENYMVDGGPRLAWLEAIRSRHAISLHGVALSLAADTEPEPSHLARFAALTRRIEPRLVSEHLAWSTWRGVYHPDLLPFPRTNEALIRITDSISRTQDKLRRRIAIENPSHYLRINEHTWDEIDFFTELVRRSGCGLLLDVSNVYVSARNLGFSATDYIDSFPEAPVLEIHLAGHTLDPNMGDALLIDSHDTPVAPEVWTLYERLVSRIGSRPTLIERDGNLPDFSALLVERQRADAVLNNSSTRTSWDS
jgi:uncharacterized protein (UPF0276 family)